MWWKRLLQAGAILVLTCIVTEIAFRAVHAVHPIFIFPSVSYRRFLPSPRAVIHGFEHDSQGFKDLEPRIPKPAGVRRILMLGDSFVYGAVPYPHVFATVLEQILAAEHPESEVTNRGIPRTGLPEYLHVLETEGPRLEPDAVVVAVFLGNDFQTSAGPPKEPRSYLATFLRYAFGIRPGLSRGAPTGAREFDDDQPTKTVKAYDRILDRQGQVLRRHWPQLEPSAEEVGEYLSAIRTRAAQLGAPTLVVLLPQEMQVDEEVLVDYLSRRDGLVRRQFDLDRPNRVLEAILARREIEPLDMLPALRAAQETGPVYVPRDSHLNIRGNRLVAEAIAAEIGRRGWFDGDAEPVRDGRTAAGSR